jgi:hypothetical protein
MDPEPLDPAAAQERLRSADVQAARTMHQGKVLADVAAGLWALYLIWTRGPELLGPV